MKLASRLQRSRVTSVTAHQSALRLQCKLMLYLSRSRRSLMTYLEARGANIAGTKQESELLIAVAPHLSRFIARLFGVERERATHIGQITAQDPIVQFKTFTTRRALKKFPAEQALTID